MSNYTKIFTELKRQMNGAVTDGMRSGGVSYGMNYGVSLPTIKSIAQTYGIDHVLATDLWRQEVRELQLAAAYIDDPKFVTIEDFNKWSKKWEALEIAQVTAMELLHKAPCAVELATLWFNDPLAVRHTAACHIVGKIAQNLDPETLSQFVTPQNNAFSLREIYKHHPSLQQPIKEIAAQVHDLEWQLEYL